MSGAVSWTSCAVPAAFGLAFTGSSVWPPPGKFDGLLKCCWIYKQPSSTRLDFLWSLRICFVKAICTDFLESIQATSSLRSSRLCFDFLRIKWILPMSYLFKRAFSTPGVFHSFEWISRRKLSAWGGRWNNHQQVASQSFHMFVTRAT